MGKNVVKQGLRQQQRTLSERIANLEQGLAQVLFKINQRFSAVEQKIATAAEVVDALVQLGSAEDVQQVITDKRVERARAQSAQEKASLDQGVTDGYIIPGEKIGERSILVGRYLDKEGTVEEPGRSQLVMPGIAPQYREKLLTQAAGYKLAIDNGGTFEVQAVYEVDEAKHRAFQEAKAAEATAAAAKAAAEAGNKDEAKDTAPEQPEAEAAEGDADAPKEQ